MSIDNLNTKDELGKFVVEYLEANPLPVSAVEGLEQSLQVGKWNPMTLVSGFANFGAGNSGAAYRMIPGGGVQIRGLIAKATETASPALISTLPVKPKELIRFPAVANDSVAGDLVVWPTGEVTWSGPVLPPGAFLTLSGIIFWPGT